MTRSFALVIVVGLMMSAVGIFGWGFFFNRQSMAAIFGSDSIIHHPRWGVVFIVLGLGLGLVIARRVSNFVARGITDNVAKLQAGVRRIRSGRLDQRVTVRSGDEIEDLADAFNDMADELQQTIGRLRVGNTELQALDQAKVDLVANVSHELRTPLTALKGFLELLDEGELGELGPEAGRAISVCRRNVDRLALRVEDLVLLSQMENVGPDERPAGPVDLEELISVVTELYEERIRSNELYLVVETASNLPEVAGNVQHLESVFQNLMDNAVKFTPSGGTISIAADECDREGREGVLVRVVDSGIGIPARELIRIFDRFHQVDQSIRRRFGGMGLGLSVVHHIVESHRGIVWAESEEGVGSAFFVWLPRYIDGENREDGL